MGTIEKRVTDSGLETFRAKVRLKGCPVQSATFRRKTDAKKWIQDTESAIRDGRFFSTAEAKRHTVASLIDRYVRTVLPTKPKSEAKQTQQLDWWRKRIGAYSLKDLSPALIAECRDELLGSYTVRKKLYSPATVNRYLAALSHACTIAVKEWGWMSDNPVLKIRKPPEPPGRVRFLSDAERDKLLQACKQSKNPNLYLAVVLGLSTGAREMEIWGLQWEQVDTARGYIRLRPTDTKGKEPRSLPLRGLALQLMQKYAADTRSKTGFVFPGKTVSKPMDFRSAWEAALSRATIKDFTYHDLRHSTASYLAMNGATLTEIAEVLGHKTLHMVKRYAHLSAEHTAKVVASMNERIFANDQQ